MIWSSTHPMTAAESYAWRPELRGHSDDILPFFTQIESRVPKGGMYVEVGVFLGRSLAFMGDLRPDLLLVGVDKWTQASMAPSLEGEVMLDPMAVVRAALGPRMSDAVLVRQPFDYYASTILEPIADMVFIDGSHLYPDVCADIIAAKRILKPGGILSGHDYAGGNGVVRAVRELVGDICLSDWDGPTLPGADSGKGRCWWTIV